MILFFKISLAMGYQFFGLCVFPCILSIVCFYEFLEIFCSETNLAALFLLGFKDGWQAMYLVFLIHCLVDKLNNSIAILSWPWNHDEVIFRETKNVGVSVSELCLAYGRIP